MIVMGKKHRISKALLSLLKRAGKKIENRIFYVVFQVTRVTNDHYGWDPEKEEEK